MEHNFSQESPLAETSVTVEPPIVETPTDESSKSDGDNNDLFGSGDEKSVSDKVSNKSKQERVFSFIFFFFFSKLI